MKSRSKQNVAIAAVGAWWTTNIFVVAKALHASRAAQRDERNGFPYTAAMEWRNAAELFASGTRAADYFWQQWERIMHLPRRLAAPMSDSQFVARPALVPASVVRPMINADVHQFSSATAA